MIDTVKMIGNYEIDDTYLESSSIPWTYIGSFEETLRPDGILSYYYVYKKRDDPLSIKYKPSKREIEVEVSVPKFLNGHNTGMISDQDITRFLMKLDQVLQNKFYAFPMQSSFYWMVTRMDVCWNFHVGGAVKEYIRAYQQIHIPKYTTRMYGDGETIEWLNKSNRLHFYNKEKEVNSHRGGEELEQAAQGILRFEANVRSKALTKFSKHRWCGELLNEKTARKLLLLNLRKIGVDRALKFNSKMDTVNKLIDEYGWTKTESLIGFMELLQLYGQAEVRRQMSPSTFNRKMKAFSDIDLAPAFSEKSLPPLDISFLEDHLS